MAVDRVDVQSVGNGYPIAGRYHSWPSTAFGQYAHITDPSSEISVNVRSYAGSNPMAVALTGLAGEHLSVLSVHVANALTITAWSSWIVNTVPVTQAGNWTFTGSTTVIGSVGATVTGSVQATVIGSVGVSQLGAPWTFTGSATVTGSVGALVTGTVVASVVGQQTVTASVTGNVTVTASCVGQQTVTASVAGTIPVTQSTNPWVVVGSVGVTQQTSPWIVQQGSSGAFVGYVVASIVGGGSSVTGSVFVTQASSPWVTRAGSTGDFVGFVVASIVGGGSTVTGSVFATQASSPWVTRAGSTGDFVGFVVASIVGGGSTVIGSVNATQVGSWREFIVGGGNGLTAGVSSYGGDGNLLRVDLVRGTLSAGADGAITDGSDSTIKATVRSYSGSKPLAVALTDLAGNHTTVLSVAGTTVASVVGQVTVTASCVGQQTVTASIAGNVPVTQTGAPWSTIGSVSVTGSVGALVIGSVTATQGGAPWTFTGSTAGTTVASVIGNPTVVASVVGQQTVTASVIGQITVTASVAGTLPITGTVTANQGGAPWSFTGSVGVTQVGSPWFSQLTSGGQFVGFTVASVVGQQTVTASVVGQVSVTASCVGQQTVTASIAGVPAVSQSGAWTFTGSVGASQLGAPWSVIGSVSVTGSVGALVTGTVVASVIGQPTVTASVIGQLTTTASISGNVPVTQVTSPWITQAGSTGQFVGFVVASVVGGGSSVTGSVWITNTVYALQAAGAAWTVVASVIGQPTVQASVVGQLFATTSISGVPTVVASVIGNPTTVASVIGQVTVTASCVGQQFVTASCVGQQTVTASVTGQLFATTSISGIPTFTGSVQVGQPYFTSSFTTYRVTVPASGTLVYSASAPAGWKRALIQHIGMWDTTDSNATVWAGPIGVTSATGFPIAAGGVLDWPMRLDLYACTLGTSLAVSANSGQELAIVLFS